MQCPVCTSTNLLISERQGIEIDYCPQCRGVWLDRGELDKLIERSPAGVAPTSAPQQRQAPPVQQGYDQRHGHSGHHRDSHGYDYKRKKKGFLGEIFDFD
ncbi:zf-TFIIB domain-containing protein [Herbaspirillum sp. LeCh32-8]|uniref:TFIIB-type zinc ribbon-containing protein n=1 Tax=Herbaspirillum sp. LeCh32-8 TaxID=2821356 RepID=UPI001AEA2389|nr:zf-TFIIB domain-containing protein [Herbaspirillum sp. LeCh32-8]MBP0599982.1 zf-TFIIB domain-containing protein [Herbaspirillum sp. LeCh32-8]